MKPILDIAKSRPRPAASAASAAVGAVFDIKRYAIHDGPGIRTTVFLTGCLLRCPWCHNPECWDEALEDRLTAGRMPEPVVGDEVSTIMTVAQLMDEIEKDVLFFDESGGGVTFSGGEPLLQAAFVGQAARLCKQRDIHVTVDSCCFPPWESIEPLLGDVDLFLCDVKHMDSQTHHAFTGVPNERILANIRKLAERGCDIVLRLPLIPGFNESHENIEATGEFAASLPGVERIDVLPYHDLMLAKFDKLKVPVGRPHFARPDDKLLERVQQQLESRGLRVKRGG